MATRSALQSAGGGPFLGQRVPARGQQGDGVHLVGAAGRAAGRRGAAQVERARGAPRAEPAPGPDAFVAAAPVHIILQQIII